MSHPQPSPGAEVAHASSSPSSISPNSSSPSISASPVTLPYLSPSSHLFASPTESNPSVSPATAVSGAVAAATSHSEHGEEDDDKDNTSKNPMIAIVGRTADPFNKENWEDDFELDEDEDAEQESNLSSALMRMATTASAAIPAATSNVIHEKDDASHSISTSQVPSPSNSFRQLAKVGGHTDAAELASTAKTALNLSFPSHANQQPDDIDDLDDLDDDDNHDFQTKSPASSTPLTPHKHLSQQPQLSGSSPSSSTSPPLGSRNITPLLGTHANNTVGINADTEPDEEEEEDDEFEEDWDAEIREEEVREAAAKGLTPEQIAQLLKTQSALVSNDHAKRHHMLNGLNESTGRTAGGALLSSPEAGGARKKRPPPVDEDDGLGSFMADDEKDKKPSTAAMRAVTANLANAARSQPFAFFSPTTQSSAPQTTVSPSDPLLSSDYTLNSSISLTHLLAQNDLALAQQAAAASASSSAGPGGAAAAAAQAKAAAVANLLNPKINIVMYPTPSQLLSLKTEDGLSGYNEKQLESWLKHLVTKHGPVWKMKCVPLDGELDASSLGTSISAMEPLPNLLASTLYRINHLYRQQVTLESYRSIKGTLPTPTNSGASLPSILSQPTPAATAWSLLVSLFNHIESRLNFATSSGSPIECLNDEPCFRLLYSLLFIGAKLWNNAIAPQFGNMIKIAHRLFPLYAGMLQVLELETLAHHDGTKANRLMRIFVSLYKRYAPAAATTPAAATAQVAAQTTGVSAEVCAQALVGLNFYLNNFSPLTTADLSERAAWDKDDSNPAAFEWLDRAWAGEKPNPANSASAANHELEQLTWELCGAPEFRMNLLKDLYSKLPAISFVKARVAFAIGQYIIANVNNANAAFASGASVSSIAPPAVMNASTSSSVAPSSPYATSQAGFEPPMKVAEKWLMECLYILDHISPSPRFPWDAANQFAPPGPVTAASVAAAAAAGSNILASGGVTTAASQTSGVTTNKSAQPTNPTRPHSSSVSSAASPANASGHPVTCTGLPIIPMMSELGCNALKLYGDVLLALNKYKYAILSYESALANYQYRRSLEFHSLNSRLVEVTMKEEDMDRSIAYYIKILEKSQLDGDLNMYVYLVQQLSKLEVSQGHFRRSEEHLRSALNFLRPFSVSSNSRHSLSQHHDASSRHSHTHSHHHSHHQSNAPSNSFFPPQQVPPVPGCATMWDFSAESHAKFALIPPSEFRSATLNIFLQLSRLYLEGDRILNAIMVLEMLMRAGTSKENATGNASQSGTAKDANTGGSSSQEGLTRSKLNQVYLLLATAYMRKKKYVKARSLLKAMEELNGLNPSASTAHYLSANAEARDTVFAITPVGPQQLTHTPHQMSISHSQQHGQHTVNASFSASRSAFAHTGRAASVGHGASSTAVNSPISTYSTLSLLSPASSLSANSSYNSPPPVAHPLSHILDQSLYNDFLALQSKIAMHSNDFLTALHFLSLSFASINPGANLGAMARLNFRRGQVLQRICLEVAKGNGSKDLERAGIVIKVSNAHHYQQHQQQQTQQQQSKQAPPSTPNLFTPSAQHHPAGSFSSNSLNSANLVSPSAATAQQQQMAAAALSGPAIKLLVLDDSCGDGAGIVLPDPSLAVQSFYDSYSYFSLVDDSLHTTSALSQIVDTYLGIIFPPLALFDVPCTHPQIRDWLQLAGFDTSESLRAAPTEAFDKFLKTVEELCVEVTESCMSSLQILPLLTVYAQLMEIKLLQGRWRESAAFFLELKNAFYQLFIVSPLTNNKAAATQSKSKSATTSAPAGAASTATTSPSLSQGTFNLLLHKSTPGFTRAVYMLLKRLARMIPAFASMWRGATHEMGKDHDDAQTTGGHTRTHTAHPSSTAHAGLRARIRSLDPTLVARECRAFARSHLDVLDVLQLYETEVMNEEVAMELAMSNTHAQGEEDDHNLLSSAQAKAPPVFQSSNSSLNLSPTKSPTNGPTINVNTGNNGAEYTSGVSGGVYSMKSWNEQRFLVFGALGSRSLMAHHRPSLAGGELLSSPFAALSVAPTQNSGAAMSPAQSTQLQATQRFLALGEKLCFSLSEMERAASKSRSSGTRSRGGAAEDQKLLHQKNNFILARMQQLMKSMRKLVSGNSVSMSGSVDASNDPIFPPIVPPSPSNASLVANAAAPALSSSQKLNLASTPNYPGNNAIVNAPRRLTTWVAGPYTIGAGLFPSLVYVVPLDNVLFVYSPRGHHMLLRPFMPNSGAIYNTMLYPPQLVPSPQFLDRALRDFQRTKPMSLPRLPPPLQQTHDNNKSEHHRTINASRVEGGKSMLSLEQTLSASPPSANNPRSLVDPTSNLQKSVHVKGHVHRRSHSVGLTLPTNATLSPMPPEPDAAPCHVCNCAWLADHSWEEGFCRNCYHVHAAPLISAIEGNHSPDVTVVIDDDMDDEDEDDEDENEDDEEEDLEEEEEDELRELESEDEFPSLHNRSDAHHTPQVRNKRSVSKKISITRSLRGSLSSDPSIRRLVPTDADTFLPPALDLAHVRELFNSLDPQNLLLVFAAMFSECRILFVSNSNFRLMAVMNSLVKLMHPFTWQFAFIPLLTRKNANLILQQPPQSVLERQYSTRSSILGVASVNSHSGSSNTKRTSIIGSPSASPASIPPSGHTGFASASTPLSPFLIGVHSTLLSSLLRGAPSMGDTVPAAATSSSLPPTPTNAAGPSGGAFSSAHPLPMPGALAPNIVQVDLDRNRVRYAAGLFVTLPPRIKFRLQKACMRFLSVCFVLETGAQAKAQAAAQAKAQRADQPPVAAPIAQPASTITGNLDLPSLSRRGSANEPRRSSVTSPATSPPNAAISPPAASSSVSISASNAGVSVNAAGGAPTISSPSSPSFRHFRTTSELSRQITMQPPVLPDHLSPGERSESRPENEGSESPVATSDIVVALEPLPNTQASDSLKSKVALVSNNASTVGAQPQPSARYLLTDLFYPPQSAATVNINNSRSAGATPEKFGVEPRGSVISVTADPNAKANQALKSLRDSFLSAFVSLFYRSRLFWKDAAASGQAGEVPSSNQGGLAVGIISTSAAPSTTLVGGLGSSTHAGLASASASVVPGGAPLSVRAFLEHSKQANQTFLQNFLMRTRAFKAFVFARATCPPAALLAHTSNVRSRLSSSASSSPEPASRLLEALRASPTFGFGRPNIRVHPSYKFDAIVLSTLRNKLSKIRARSLESAVCSHAHAIYFAHGSGGRRGKFQKRYLALVGNKLMVHKVPLGLLIAAPVSPLVTAEPEYVLYEREKGDEDLLGPVASQPSVPMSSSSASAASSFAAAITTVAASAAPALINTLTSSKKLLTKPAKYIRDLQPGQIKLIQPVLIEDKSIGVTSGEGNQFFTFQLVPAFISTSQNTPAAAVEPWWIRCETESECRYWMKLIESRIMEPELKQLYEKFA